MCLKFNHELVSEIADDESIGAWLYRYCGDTVAGVSTAWLVSSSTGCAEYS